MIQPSPHPRQAPRVGITAVGSSLPETVLTSEQLQQRLAAESDLRLPPGMVTRMTGIMRRRIAADDEYASTLAVRAARQALAAARLTPADVDLLLFASASRDMVRARDRPHRPGRTGQPGTRSGRHQRLQQLPQRHRPGPFDDPRRAGPAGAGGDR